MRQLLREVVNHRELIWALALKELRARYKRSALGFLWALLHPLLMMVILTVVFSTLARLPLSDYAVFLITALAPWTFLTQALSYGVESIVSNGELLKKIYIPKSVFPLAAVLANVINFLLSLVPMALLLLVLRFPFHLTWLYLPVATLALVLFVLGCSFFFAAANVFFRDVAHILQILLAAWFYVSPIIYSLDFVPPQFRGYFRLNPMLYLLNGFRNPIYYGQWPSQLSIAVSFAIGLLALWAGYAFFRKSEDAFVYYI